MNLKLIIDDIADKIEKNKDYLTDLDRAIGDSDHGINLSRGFQKIKEVSDEIVKLPYGEMFNKIAMIIISNVGGASGAIYGTGFMRVAQKLKGVEVLDREKFIEGTESLINGMMERGKSHQGEKTLLDVAIPTLEYLKNSKEEEIELLLFNIKKIASLNMEGTKNTLATKGRASYLGERSIGHIDPGAMSFYLIVETICEKLMED